MAISDKEKKYFVNAHFFSYTVATSKQIQILNLK